MWHIYTMEYYSAIIIILILRMRRFRHRKFKLLAQGHKAELVFKSRQLSSRSHALILTTPLLHLPCCVHSEVSTPLSTNDGTY